MLAFFVFIFVVFMFMNQIEQNKLLKREQRQRIENDMIIYKDVIEKCKLYNDRYVDMYDNSYKVFMA